MGKFNFFVFKSLAWANIKMFFRDRSALFWSLFFPVLIMGIFGVLDFAKGGKTDIGIVYDENSKQIALQIKENFDALENFMIHEGDLESELREMENDDRALIIAFKHNPKISKTEIVTYINKSKEQSGSILAMTTESSLNRIALTMTKVESPFSISSEVVNVNDLRTIDYMVPGIIAMSIMQSGLFGVVGTIVNYREQGILKRLFATPLSKSEFILSQIVARLTITALQVVFLLAIAYAVFQIKIVGSLPLVATLATLGGLIFLAMGFLFSGLAKTSETSRALVAPVQMLMMFTGGVYFDRSVLPGWLFNITAYSPLTYLADALREVMVMGYGLADQTVRIATIGMLVWFAGLVLVAVRTFKWEKS